MSNIIPLKSEKLPALEPKSLAQIVDLEVKGKIDAAVEEASFCEGVVDQASCEYAANIVGALQKWIKSVMDKHEEMMAPVAGRKRELDTARNALIEPLQKEKDRILGLCTKFAREEETRRKAEAKRQAEEAARIAEQARLADEQAKAAEAAGDAAGVEEAKLQSALLQQEAVAASQDVGGKVKFEGISIAKRWTFRFVGETEAEREKSMRDAYAARPDLFELKPRTVEINKLSKSSEGKEVVPGIQFFEETKAGA